MDDSPPLPGHNGRRTVTLTVDAALLPTLADALCRAAVAARMCGEHASRTGLSRLEGEVRSAFVRGAEVLDPAVLYEVVTLMDAEPCGWSVDWSPPGFGKRRAGLTVRVGDRTFGAPPLSDPTEADAEALRDALRTFSPLHAVETGSGTVPAQETPTRDDHDRKGCGTTSTTGNGPPRMDRIQATGADAIASTAAAYRDLDEACVSVQRAIGQPDGGLAGLHFGGSDDVEGQWGAMSLEDRRTRMRGYVDLEFAHDPERVGNALSEIAVPSTADAAPPTVPTGPGG